MNSRSSTVVLLDSRLGKVLPSAAVPTLRTAAEVYATPDVPAAVGVDVSAAPVPSTPELLRRCQLTSVVLLAADRAEPSVVALLAAGATLVSTPTPAGTALLAAVELMDRLRSPGGCPWDAEQTHASLCQYLVEETFELLEAIEDDDRVALREELGDVLLQVLFHARVAAEHSTDPFTIDEVATGLVGKLVGRHPHVFAGGDPAVHDAVSQQRRWEELKQVEKRRESSVDGVALGQPSVALAAKLVARAVRAGLPTDLLPGFGSVREKRDRVDGTALFGAAAAAKLAGGEPEGELRAVARRFAQQVRQAEQAARRAGVDPAGMAAESWREFWPKNGSGESRAGL